MAGFHTTNFYLNRVVLCEYLRWYPSYPNFRVMAFITVLGFMLTSRYSFHAVLSEDLGFHLHPGKFFVVPNCLKFFIMDSTVDLGIANRFEIVWFLCLMAYQPSWAVESQSASSNSSRAITFTFVLIPEGKI